MNKDKVKAVIIIALIWVFTFVILAAFIIKLKSFLN